MASEHEKLLNFIIDECKFNSWWENTARPLEWLNLKRSTIPNVGDDREPLEPSYVNNGNVNWSVPLKNTAVSLNVVLSIISLLGICPRGIKTDLCKNVHCSFIHISPQMETIHLCINRRMKKINVVYTV